MDDRLLDLALLLPADLAEQDRVLTARLAGRLGFSAIHVPVTAEVTAADALDRLVRAAEPAMVVLDDGSAMPGLVRGMDLPAVRRARAELDASEDRRPLIVSVPISIGRTHSEAAARADREPAFRGAAHPRECGIFGTFEQAQEQVLALADAGAEVLLVTVPREADQADVLAQVRALVVGATPAIFERGRSQPLGQ